MSEPVLNADDVAGSGYRFSGLAVNEAIQRLCKKWGTQTVYDHLRDWVAYMDRQFEIMERHAHNDGDGCG